MKKNIHNLLVCLLAIVIFLPNTVFSGTEFPETKGLTAWPGAFLRGRLSMTLTCR